MAQTTAQLIDGKALSQQIKDEVRGRVEALKARSVKVRLDAVLCDNRPNSPAHVYAQSQAKMCRSLGIDYHLHELPLDANQDDVLGRVLLLNEDHHVHGIMVHMPLPDGVDPYRVQSKIAPHKDVEGVNPANIGNIVSGRSSLAPCTALAAVRMIEATGVELRGARAVVVGSSDIVGKPLAVMLMRPEATVISCNKFTQGIEELASSADVLVVAAGVPGLVTREWVKPGAVVIDVGINRVPLDPPKPDGTKMQTVGDVAFEDVAEVAGWLSPVPGGVGPVTVAVLLSNVVQAAERAGE